MFDHVITNDTIDDAYEQLKTIFINVGDSSLISLLVSIVIILQEIKSPRSADK